MKRMFLLMSFLLLFSVSERQAQACVCNLIWPEENSIPESSYGSVKKWWLEEFKGAVFVGQILKTEKVKINRFGKLTEMRKILLKVEHSWVGANDSEIVVYSWMGDCEGSYRKGQDYFFFAESLDSKLEIAECVPSSLDNKVINSFRRWFGENKP